MANRRKLYDPRTALTAKETMLRNSKESYVRQLEYDINNLTVYFDEVEIMDIVLGILKDKEIVVYK